MRGLVCALAVLAPAVAVVVHRSPGAPSEPDQELDPNLANKGSLTGLGSFARFYVPLNPSAQRRRKDDVRFSGSEEVQKDELDGRVMHDELVEDFSHVGLNDADDLV